MMQTLTLSLAPLDERPVNTRYPQMIGAIGGATVLLPPTEIRGEQRNAADMNAVRAWLRDTAKEADGVIASAEFVGFGDLIQSRISSPSAADTIPYLSVLTEIGAAGTPVYAFNLITRAPFADDCIEEPLYWCQYGIRLHRLSAALHRREAGAPEAEDASLIARVESEISADIRQDWLNRRLRNHIVNLTLIDALARRDLAFLLITSDDTAVWGLPSREKAWLESWLSLLGAETQDRLLMHPGADEVGSVLVARFICAANESRPRICPVYAIPGDERIIAPYEDKAVQLTVEGQIRACGGVVVTEPEEADIILTVLTPSPRRTELRPEFADDERIARTPYYRSLFERIGQWQSVGKPVALGDVAYPNGADPAAMELLLSPDCPVNLAGLAGYGAWNTAGNTLGTTVAQAICSLFIRNDPARQKAQQDFLAHRFLEDWGYQTIVRRAAREANRTAFQRTDPDPENAEQVAMTCANIAHGLADRLAELQQYGIGTGLTIRPSSVRLPWRRTFEADFELV
jgi:hypothetical protein